MPNRFYGEFACVLVHSFLCIKTHSHNAVSDHVAAEERAQRPRSRTGIYTLFIQTNGITYLNWKCINSMHFYALLHYKVSVYGVTKWSTQLNLRRRRCCIVNLHKMDNTKIFFTYIFIFFLYPILQKIHCIGRVV